MRNELNGANQELNDLCEVYVASITHGELFTPLALTPEVPNTHSASSEPESGSLLARPLAYAISMAQKIAQYCDEKGVPFNDVLFQLKESDTHRERVESIGHITLWAFERRVRLMKDDLVFGAASPQGSIGQAENLEQPISSDQKMDQSSLMVLMQELSRLGLNLHARSSGGQDISRCEQLIHLAALFNRKPLLEWLLDQRCSQFSEDLTGQWPIHYAAAGGHIEIVKLLIEQGSPVDCVDEGGVSPLISYLENHGTRYDEFQIKSDGGAESLELIKLLTPDNFNPKSSDFSMGPFGWAVHGDYSEAVWDLLLEKKDASTLLSFEDLQTAVYNNNALAVHKISTHQPDLLHQLDHNGLSLLHWAAGEGIQDMVELLIEKGIDVHQKTPAGKTALHFNAADGRSDQPRITEMLLKAGIDVHACKVDKQSALHLACRSGYEEVANLLIRAGADIDQIDADGYRPLNFAAWHGHLGIVKTLVHHQADLSMLGLTYSTDPGVIAFLDEIELALKEKKVLESLGSDMKKEGHEIHNGTAENHAESQNKNTANAIKKKSKSI